ncbi:MAG: hypothetical protein RR540_06120, partial [Oscillospiraceae bacterium]
MSDIVNQIDITYIKTSIAEDKSFSFILNWDLNGGNECSYKGDYNITLYENALKKDEKKITDPLGSKYVSISFADIVLGKMYQIEISVPYSSGGVSSEKYCLIIDSFSEISGVFNGNEFEVNWEINSIIPTTLCSMSCSNGVNNLYYSNSNAGCCKFSSTDFCSNDKINITLCLTDKSVSSGPISKELHFYVSPISIISSEISKAENLFNVKMSLKSVYNDLEKVKIYFKSNENIIAVTSALALTKINCSDDKNVYTEYSLNANIPNETISYDAISNCCLYCNMVNDTAESNVFNSQSTMPAASPSIQIKEITGSKINLSITTNSAYPPIGYELNGRKNYRVEYDKAFSASVRPRYDLGGFVRKGPISNTVTSFMRGYYPSTNTAADGLSEPLIKLYQNSFAETETTRIFPQELFKARLTEKIESGSIKLEPINSNTSEYKLSINTETPLTMNDYTGFINKIKDKVKPFGFYLLCDSILRLASYFIEQTNYLLCALNPNERTADIRPGLIFNISTSVYQPQYNQKIPNSDGFSAMYSNSYPVSIHHNSDYLEFDRYAASIAEHMNISASANAQTKIIFAEGIMDMLQPAVKQPYYRILYPDKISHDYNTQTP